MICVKKKDNLQGESTDGKIILNWGRGMNLRDQEKGREARLWTY